MKYLKNKIYNYNYNEVKTKHTKYLVRDEDEIKEIFKEMLLISNEFNFCKSEVNSFKNYYLINVNYKLGTIYKNMKFIHYVLKSLGYNEEDIINYMKKNKYIFVNTYSDLVLRISLFNKIGELEKSLKYSNVYSLEYIKEQMTTKELYYILKSYNYNIDFETLINSEKILKHENITIGKSEIKSLTDELVNDLRLISKENKLIKGV